MTVPALAAAAVLAVAVGLSRTTPTTTAGPEHAKQSPVASAPHEPTRVAKSEPKPAATKPEHEPAEPTAVAEARRPIDPSRRPELPKEPPPELANAPDLFMDMNILSHMEKLQHYDAIETTTLHDPAGEQPNG